MDEVEQKVSVRVLSPTPESSAEAFERRRHPEFSQPPRTQDKKQKRRSFLRISAIIAGIIAFILLGAGMLLAKTGFTFNGISQETTIFLGIDLSLLPQANPKEKDRLDVLILGIRGEKDPNGGLLTDALMLVSINTDSGETAFISVPRDIYLEIPLVKTRAKINEAYAIGEQRQYGGGGLILAKLAVQEITGVNIDYAVSIDFKAFEEMIDTLGGIDVRVARPFRENLQWGGIDFVIPAGIQHMDSKTALLYIRSRFTTSDFDRSRRQQEVLIAMKEKAFRKGFLANPKKIFALLDAVGRHVRTDISIKGIAKLIPLAKRFQNSPIERIVLDNQSGLLSASVSAQGSYILKPSEGTFKEIRTLVRGIFNE